jgi:triphosphoribosyl-dephospho-CoA synthetase
MHRTVHAFLSERRFQYICVAFLLVQFTFSIGLGSFAIVEAQNNNTNQNTTSQETTRVDEILSDACNSVAADNDTSANMSQSGSVIEIRCILREARNAISAESANTAIELVEAADKKLVATFGNATNETGSVGSTSTVS